MIERTGTSTVSRRNHPRKLTSPCRRSLGQRLDVNIYKLTVIETVEDRILAVGPASSWGKIDQY